MEIIYQVLGALLALFFIFLTYLNTKTWRWVHVTFTFLVFVASVTFCVYAAMTLKTRAKWIKDHDNLEKQLATVTQELENTTRGDPKDTESKTPSVLSLREEIARTVIDRGRVWRGVVVQIRQGAVSAITAPPADPNNPAAPPPKKHNIQAKTVLYAFREAQKSPPDGPVLPASYIGEFRATPVNDQSLTLEPTMPLAPDQLAAAQIPGTWTLYEVCPVDGHQWFTGDEKERLEPLADAAGLDRLPKPVYDKMIGPYVRDGGEWKDTDPPENAWYELKFNQEYEVTVDAPIVSSLDIDPFNSEGQAVLQRLRRRGGATPEEPGKVTFGPKEGQINTAVLDQETAQSLIDRGVATLQKKIYRRKLTDYERKFHAINERVAELIGRMRQLTTDNNAMLAAVAKAEQQMALVEELKGKANADLAKVNYELTELTKYKDSLNERLATIQNELSQLYLANKTIARELARLTAELTTEIDRRTREATAMTKP